jgi:cold shock CspA family protein
VDIEVVRRICLARHLYGLAKDHSSSENELYLFSTVNLLQDAVEAFLVAIADHLELSFDARTTFDQYFVKINETIDPSKLPFKPNLLRLNRIRVDSKHHGIKPAKDEVDRLVIVVNEFFEETCRAILAENFYTLSTIDLVNNGDTKQLLLEAKAQFESGALDECSISCRKAIYSEIEKNYDISQFEDGAAANGLRGLFGPHSDAPYFSKNSDYIKKHVKIPTDYVVHDPAHLNQELVKYGIDNTAFWNLIRLTPPVFKNSKGDWHVKRDFNLLDNEFLAEKIQYILDTAINIVFSIHSTQNTIKTQGYQRFNMDLAKENTPVYEKASRESELTGHTPLQLRQIDCDYRIEGLSGDGPYWKVTHWQGESFISGFIHNDDLTPEAESQNQISGRVKWYSNDRGYGFIRGVDGNDYFVHHSEFEDTEGYELSQGSSVSFVGKREEKGLAAKSIRIAKAI